MPAIERTMSIRGPRFYQDGGVMMFVNYFDASTRIGPRVATDQDMLDYPEALAAAEKYPDPEPPEEPSPMPRGGPKAQPK